MSRKSFWEVILWSIRMKTYGKNGWITFKV